MPTLRIVASPFVESYGPANNVSWTLPISRTETKILTLLVRPIGAPRIRARYDGKTWDELTEEEHRRLPGDYEAQVGQGAVTFHSHEHLAGSDRGVSMFRHLYRQQVDAVAAGRDPIGVAFDDESARYEILAGNFLE